MTKPQLSEKVRELIQKSRIVSFSTWQDSYSAAVIQRFQTADDQGRYLTDEDMVEIERLAPEMGAGMAIAQQLRDRAADIVDEARTQVLSTFPDLTQPGGGLYPAERAEACWRDFWHFLRCITYGIAGERTDYISGDGLHSMQLLYRELQVPLEAMVLGLEGVKTASLKRIETDTEVSPCFDRLIDALKQFQ